ncbi:cation:proton antiporter [Nonomuraea sp. NPDC050328]|uniref:cation:proton antiporter n=1 Tax=Nonomuraea sp. NPDC050328 TaxID=3364361 RepID=UPI0037AF40FD
MSDHALTSVLVVALAAMLAPILAAASARVVRVPNVVLEILLGVLVGPVVLGWVRVDGLVAAISDFGLAMLMFMAGFEIEFQRIRGRPIRLAVLGWLISLAAGMAIGLALFGFGTAAQVIGLALTTTALGTILPMVRDAGALGSPFGGRVLAMGALGEFGPIVVMAFVFSEDEKIHTVLVIALFALIAIAAAAWAARPRDPRLGELVSVTMSTSGQLGVRIVMFVLVLMLWLAATFRLDVLLGAFAAGIVIRLAVNSGPPGEEEIVASKLDGIGFGMLIPFFFVISGVTLDLKAMFASPASLLLIPVFLLLFLLVRGLPTYLLNRRDPELRPGEPRALGLFAAAALPLIVVITNTGVEEGVLTTSTAAAMVTAGVISVMIYPLAALRLYRAAEQNARI